MTHENEVIFVIYLSKNNEIVVRALFSNKEASVEKPLIEIVPVDEFCYDNINNELDVILASSNMKFIPMLLTQEITSKQQPVYSMLEELSKDKSLSIKFYDFFKKKMYVNYYAM